MSRSDAKYVSGVRATPMGSHAYRGVHHSVVLPPSRRLDRAEYCEAQLLVKTHLRQETKLSPSATCHTVRTRLPCSLYCMIWLTPLRCMLVSVAHVWVLRALVGAFRKVASRTVAPYNMCRTVLRPQS